MSKQERKKALKRWLTAVRKLCHAVDREIEYKAEAPGRNEWQTPEETMSLGTGDCEDLQMLKRKRLMDADLIRGEDAVMLQGDYRGTGHAVLQINYHGKKYLVCNINGVKRSILGFKPETAIKFGPATLDILDEHGT